ncbi:hypothetical protein PAXINDRAFT_15689 [Paxillus involutus ATCC 200175]|uniref:Uncharacterized protein n=1 Tax=Paxillus involutus ATCC 200175 TaxID=664439 RepID=A0A0C9TL17_PAXIN|nr:hypothetical protein PAXINDRAFT_15689 [Paxillus involutus ATCC 200175]
MAGVAALMVHTGLSTPGGDIRRLVWMWGWAAVSWTWWARHLSSAARWHFVSFIFPHLPHFSSSPLPFPPFLTSSSLCVFVLRVDVRCLAWTWGRADVSWTWWARCLPPVVSLSVVCHLSALCLPRLPFSPSFLFVSLSLPRLFIFRVFVLRVDTAGVAVLAVHARLSTPCVDAWRLTWGWGLVDAKGVDVGGTPSPLGRLIVCRSSALHPRLPFSLGFLHLLTFSLPPCLFISPCTHAARRGYG